MRQDVKNIKIAEPSGYPVAYKKGMPPMSPFGDGHTIYRFVGAEPTTKRRCSSLTARNNGLFFFSAIFVYISIYYRQKWQGFILLAKR